MKFNLKQMVSRILSLVMATTIVQCFPVDAANNQENSSCVLFAQGLDDSIHIKAQSISMNGDVVTNGFLVAEADYKGINGTLYEEQDNCMIDYYPIIEDLYYSDEVSYIDASYTTTEYNENIFTSTFVQGEFISANNVSVNDTALMTIDDIVVEGNTFNATNSVIYSQMGNIRIDTENFSASGLIYAPFGTVYIESNSVNINGTIIAQKIEIIGDGNVNINKNENFLKTLGEGIKTPTDVEEDDDIVDIGEAYFKDVTSEDDIIYAGEGIYCVKNQILLTTDDSINFNEVSELAATYNASIVGYIELTNDYQIEFNTDVTVETLFDTIAELETYDYVVHAFLNIWSMDNATFCTNDTELASAEWEESNPSGNNWHLESMKVASAFETAGIINNTNSTELKTDHLYNVKIGLLDNMFDEYENVEDADITFVDTWNNYEYDVLQTTISNTPASDRKIMNHGTHVAGIMAAKTNNESGIASPCVKNRLYGYSFDGGSLNVGSSDTNKYNPMGNGTFEIKYALALLIGNNVKIINYSYGRNDVYEITTGDEQALNSLKEETKIIEAFLLTLLDKDYDFTIVAAAGNGSDNVHGKCADAQYGSTFLFSNNYKIRSRVVCVGNLQNPDINGGYAVANSSNGGNRVDILAPGKEIYSCAVRGNGDGGTNYVNMEGTSMAAPNVSGVLGLTFSRCPLLSSQMLKSALLSQGRSEQDVYGNALNCEIVDASALMNKAINLCNMLTTSGRYNTTENHGGLVIGSVGTVDENKIGISLADVQLSITSYDSTLVEYTTTDADGGYAFALPAGNYYITYYKEGYTSNFKYNVEVVEEETTYLETVILLQQELSTETGMISGTISNAIDGSYIDGATIRFRDGWNSKSGAYSTDAEGSVYSVITDSNGDYNISMLVGAYTAVITKSGYVTSYVNVFVTPDEVEYDAVITPVLAENQYRIVLTWADTPSDLDSHLQGTLNGDSYHVFYSNKLYSQNGTTIAQLDWDDRNSYGPETITLTWTDNGGECLYYVHDYTNRFNSSSYALSNSSAKVVVYQGNSIIATYNVPIAQQGTVWNVFKISDGKLSSINTIS